MIISHKVEGGVADGGDRQVRHTIAHAQDMVWDSVTTPGISILSML